VDVTGQNPGHEAGFTWGEYLAALVAEHGTLSAVAWKLATYNPGHGEDVANIERALRRLRGKGAHDGGSWGQRLLRRFGLPRALEEKLRWMGLYHSPFTDLPLDLCRDQLRLWDRPPVAESRARQWLQLGFASVALRSRNFDDAESRLAGVSPTGDDARLELMLCRLYLHSRTGKPVDLDEPERLLQTAALDPVDAACFRARLVDHRAYALNREQRHTEALALYQSLPADDVHPFASYRRDAGLAYGWLRSDRERALLHARRACQHAGDGGYVRLRVMALILLSRLEPPEPILARAQAIAERLGDTELLSRIARRRQST
jgi:hypothetical protein